MSGPPDDQIARNALGLEWSCFTPSRFESGVRIEGDHLLWWEHPLFHPHTGGGACEQSFADFLARGPRFDWLSPRALEELSAAVRSRSRE